MGVVFLVKAKVPVRRGAIHRFLQTSEQLRAQGVALRMRAEDFQQPYELIAAGEIANLDVERVEQRTIFLELLDIGFVMDPIKRRSGSAGPLPRWPPA